MQTRSISWGFCTELLLSDAAYALGTMHLPGLGAVGDCPLAVVLL